MSAAVNRRPEPRRADAGQTSSNRPVAFGPQVASLGSEEDTLSLALIRENPDIVRQALAARQTEAPLDDLLALDGQRRRLLQQVETLRAERNAAGKEIGRLSQAAEQAGRRVLPREKDFQSVEEQDQSAGAAREQADSIARRDELLERMRGVSQQIEELEDELRGVDERLNDLLLQVPNMPDPRCPWAPTRRTTSSCARRASRAPSTSSRCRTGSSASARHHRLRARRQDLRLALLRAHRAPARACSAR